MGGREEFNLTNDKEEGEGGRSPVKGMVRRVEMGAFGRRKRRRSGGDDQVSDVWSI